MLTIHLINNILRISAIKGNWQYGLAALIVAKMLINSSTKCHVGNIQQQQPVMYHHKRVVDLYNAVLYISIHSVFFVCLINTAISRNTKRRKSKTQ